MAQEEALADKVSEIKLNVEIELLNEKSLNENEIKI